MRNVALVMAALALTPTTSVGQVVQADTIAARPGVLDLFPVGETLIFDGKWGLVRLGRASLQVVGVDTIRGEPAVNFRFLMDASLLGAVSLKNRFDSWVGVDDFASRRFTQDFDEMGSQRTTAYEIFPDSGIYWEQGVDTAKVSSDNPLDDTAFFYFVRSLDLEPGARHEFNNYFRPDRNPVIVEVMERDTIDVPAGRFPTIVVHPIIKGGMFADDKHGRVWISDDERRLIVQIKTKLPVIGTITMRLTEVIDPREGAATTATTQPGGSAGR